MLEDQETLRGISLFLILFSVIIIVLFIVFVHTMPGKIARKRAHPQAEAVEILALLGLLMFPLWMAALVWAYIKPFRVPVSIDDSDGVVPDRRPLPGGVGAAELPGGTARPESKSALDAGQET